MQKTRIILSSCLRSSGSFLISSSSSAVHPSMTVLRFVFMGFSPSSGRAEMMYFGSNQPIWPLLTCTNCAFRNASLPCS